MPQTLRRATINNLLLGGTFGGFCVVVQSVKGSMCPYDSIPLDASLSFGKVYRGCIVGWLTICQLSTRLPTLQVDWEMPWEELCRAKFCVCWYSYCVGWALQALQSYSNDDGRPQKGKQQPDPQVSSNSVVVHPDPRMVRIDVSRSVRCFKWRLHIPRLCVVFPIHIRYVSVQRHVAGLPWSAMEQITGWEPRLPPRMLAHLFISCSAREKRVSWGPNILWRRYTSHPVK
jgi:hypothetical protein